MSTGLEVVIDTTCSTKALLDGTKGFFMLMLMLLLLPTLVKVIQDFFFAAKSWLKQPRNTDPNGACIVSRKFLMNWVIQVIVGVVESTLFTLFVDVVVVGIFTQVFQVYFSFF